MDSDHQMLQFFKTLRLTDNEKQIGQPFLNLAETLVDFLPKNQERTDAVRTLLKSRDAAVRALNFVDGT